MGAGGADRTPLERDHERSPMTPTPSIAQHLESQSVVVMESTIPADMTIAEWRRKRSAQRSSARRRFSSGLAAARRVVPLRPVACDHLHDTTTRYNHDQKLLTFVRVCHACGTEELIDTLPYEPQFKPHAAGESAGATIHQLPVRRPRHSRRWAA
jgi:hypothetical protein